jgi:thiamine-phosphate pyrophosphorylase
LTPTASHLLRSVPLKGLYVILDPQVSATRRPLVDCLIEAAAAGCRLFQYRAKTDSIQTAYRLGLELRRAAADVQTLFIVNDRCDLALALDADGVHLGQEDLPVALARAILGPDRLIGISTHREAEVREATEGGADYIGYGPIYPTTTKPDHEPVVGIAGLQQARGLTSLPIFAIGGITLENLAAVRKAGADGVAVISAIASCADVRETANAFMNPFR